MKKIFLLNILVYNFYFLQAQKSDFTLIPRKFGIDYPYNSEISEKVNGIDVLNKNYKFLDSINFYSLNYKSFDNLNIRGFLLEPKKKGIYPVVIFNRGGNGDFGLLRADFLANFLAKITNEGYVVIGTQLRGNALSEGFDEFGGKDINDVLSLFAIIDQLPNAVKSRIAIMGWSRGVMTNFLTLKKTNRIKTNIAISGLTELNNFDRPDMYSVYRERIPNYAKDSITAMKTRSSLFAVDSIQNKNLTNFIIHGNKDERVNVRNAFDIYSKLNKSNFTSRLLIYENEPHNLAGVRPNLINSILDWLNKYL